MRALLRHPFRFATASLLLEMLAAVAGFGTGVAGLQAAARYSGRMGLAWFGLVFSISAWNCFAPGDLSRLALRRRRTLGLAFGYHHLVHLALLLTYLRAAGVTLDPGRAAGGIAGYVVLGAMMATSSDAAVARLGARNWKRLHTAGIWYLWVVFLVTYVSRLEGKAANAGAGMAEYLPCAAVVLMLAALRIAAFAKRRPRLLTAA